MINSNRRRVILTHVGATILGVVIGVSLSFWLAIWFAHARTAGAAWMAERSYKAGEEDKAIFVLTEATVEDPNYYEPFNFLGRI
jgi:hypothetical protein